MTTYLHFLARQFFITPPPLPTTLSLSSQTGLITGSNTGLGLAAAKQLLSHNLSHLILAVRSPSAGASARTILLQSYPAATISVWPLDLDSYDSILAFVERCKTEAPRLDFAILNAGLMKVKFEWNASTGNEETVQVNWLSTALLAMLLLPVLEAGEAPAPRLTTVGSETGEWTAFKEGRGSGTILGKLNEERGYDPGERYYTSKLLQMYFFREFVARAGETRVVVNIVNPGFCYGSRLHRDVPGLQGVVLGAMKRIVGRSTDMGARTLVDSAVVKGAESHGRYLEDCKVKLFWPMLDTVESKQLQKQLWGEMTKQLRPVANLSRYAEEK